MSHLLSLVILYVALPIFPARGFFSAQAYLKGEQTVVYCQSCSGGANENMLQVTLQQKKYVCP